VSKVKDALEAAKKAGIRNILALRGDPPKGAETWEAVEGGFSHAIDLVRYIRREYGDFFGIGVAGYPEGHVSMVSMEDDLKRLHDKVTAGADFIITQLFYDVDLFVGFVTRCREIGIRCPIIPGIMPIQDYAGFKRMTGFCKTAVPQSILDAMEPIKHDDARIKAYGVEQGAAMCRRLLASGSPGLHFYTLNLERSVVCILETLGYVCLSKTHELPWKQVSKWLDGSGDVQIQVSRRRREDVRPIFWANRPKSYLYRTAMWDEFPNGRWGDSHSPAFGDLSDYHLCSFKTGKSEERLKIWGAAPTLPVHVYEVFAKYIEGDVPRLPWCESQLQLETIPMKRHLVRTNACGFLTINSQPKVNGEVSSDPAVGWGGTGGYVYQKAYLEFFCSAPNLERLIKTSADFPAITYSAVDCRGKTVSNQKFGEKGVNAVTWGVFPGKEIVQPTVVDTSVFVNVWKDEAFALWKSQWQSIYARGSPSWTLIQEIHDTFYLVNIVDNDYVRGDIWAFMERVVA
jgi:methylenetetrahydrofolate reductase (NADPH)